MKRRTKPDTRLADKVAYMLTIGWQKHAPFGDGFILEMNGRFCCVDFRGTVREWRSDDIRLRRQRIGNEE